MVRAMSRALVLFTLIAGVVGASPSEAAPRSAEPSSTKAQAKPKAKAKAKPRAKAKKGKRTREAKVSRTPTKASLRRTDNMPRGFAWPPTPQMKEAEQACEARLDELGVPHQPAKSEGRIVDAITVTAEDGTFALGGVTYVSAFRNGPHKLDCQLALALTEFGQDLTTLGVHQVTFGSIYRWTNVRVGGKTKNILSRHALGIAMDIVSFTDESGRVANVRKDYKAGDELLHKIEESVNSSGKFRLLLTPANDPISHSDHFHLEAAVDYTRPTS